MNIKLIWQQALSEIKLQVTNISYDLWFSKIQIIEYKQNCLILETDSKFAKSTILKNNEQVLKQAIANNFDNQGNFKLFDPTEAQKYKNENNLTQITARKKTQYRIHDYSQDACIELGLNLSDITILKYIESFITSGNMSNFSKIADNGSYEHWYYISYNKIINDLPILKISVRQIRRVFEKLEQKNIVKREMHSKKIFIKINFFMLYDNQNEIAQAN